MVSIVTSRWPNHLTNTTDIAKQTKCFINTNTQREREGGRGRRSVWRFCAIEWIGMKVILCVQYLKTKKGQWTHSNSNFRSTKSLPRKLLSLSSAPPLSLPYVFHFLFNHLYVFISPSLSLPLSFSVSHTIFLSFYHHCLSHYHYPCLSACLSSPYLSFFLSLSSLPLPLSLYVSFLLSLSFSVFLPLFWPLSKYTLIS